MQHKKLLIVLLLFSMIYIILFSCIHSNHFLLAKFNVLISGYTSTQFIKPSQNTSLSETNMSGLDTSYLVYSHNKYIGYIDRHANFLIKGNDDIPIFQLLLNLLCFFIIRYGIILVYIVFAVYYLVFYKKRFVSSPVASSGSNHKK